jgi:hypothetical protein
MKFSIRLSMLALGIAVFGPILQGGDGVLPFRVSGEGTRVGQGGQTLPFQVDISEFKELEVLNPSIRCRLAQQASDQVALQGSMEVGADDFKLTALCRNSTGTQYEIFAQRKAASGTLEKVKFDGELVRQASGTQVLKGKLHLTTGQ